MSILPREYLETFMRNPHAADRNEVREMARELLRERDRVAEALEQRAVARARIAELEAVQGHTVRESMNAEQIRSEAIEIMSAALEAAPEWDWVDLEAVADALDVAGLLPIGVEVSSCFPDEPEADDEMMRRYVTEWRAVTQ